MNVLHEVVDWAQKDLGGWQADAVRRLLVATDFDENDKSEILAMLRNRHELLADGEKAPLPQKPSRIDAPVSRSTQGSTKILALKNLKHVNAIEGGQRLQFASEGITVVYGENASGKSGYARVLNPDFPFGRVILRSAGID